MVHCGPYKVCAQHRDTAGLCRECGAGHATDCAWHCDDAVTDYWLRCSANALPYKYVTN